MKRQTASNPAPQKDAFWCGAFHVSKNLQTTSQTRCAGGYTKSSQKEKPLGHVLASQSPLLTLHETWQTKVVRKWYSEANLLVLLKGFVF